METPFQLDVAFKFALESECLTKTVCDQNFAGFYLVKKELTTETENRDGDARRSATSRHVGLAPQCTDEF